MSSVLTDTQSQGDNRNVSIDRVGVRGLHYPLQIKTEEGSFSTIAKIDLAVNLPADVRGTHMSRFIELLHSKSQNFDLGNLNDLADLLLEKLNAEQGFISFSFPYFREKMSPITEKLSLLEYGIGLEINASGDKVDICTSIVVPVKTLCPCSKEISEASAHNQRAEVSCSFRSLESPSLGLIHRLIKEIEDSSSCELFSLLKREDEKFVTEKAYKSPVFVEDLLRNIKVRLDSYSELVWFRIEAENFESIHNHNAYGLIECDKR